MAYRQITSPQVHKLREHEMEVLEKAEQSDYLFEDYTIKLYTWSGGTDQVLLIHGWEGQAGNFAELIDRLLDQGYTIHAFDAPSHGFSSKGPSSLFEFTQLVGIMIRKFNVKKIVSHSFGAVACTYALSQNLDIQIDRYVLMTTPDKFSERIDDVARWVGINRKVKHRLIQQLKDNYQMDVADLNVSEFVQKINVDQSLILHDVDDKVIPIERAENVTNHWPEAKLIKIEGTGHFRILRTEEVLQQALDFLNSDKLDSK